MSNTSSIEQYSITLTCDFRIQKELAEIKADPPLNCSAGPKGDNLYEWVATVLGPVDSPYEAGKFLRLFHISYIHASSVQSRD